MKSTVLAAALFASVSLAQPPSCAWNSCAPASCVSSGNWDCICNNATAIETLNSCVASSCSTTDQESIYGAIAQLCANAGATVTAKPEATFSATSGGSLAQFTTGAPGGWGGNGPFGGPGGAGGSGHGGPGGFGPAWTSGWTHSGGCGPWSYWSGAWGPSSQWTGIWSACSASTISPSPATITTTESNGQVVTGTTFGVQALATTGSSASGNAAPAVTQMAAGGAMIAALVGAVVVL